MSESSDIRIGNAEAVVNPERRSYVRHPQTGTRNIPAAPERIPESRRDFEPGEAHCGCTIRGACSRRRSGRGGAQDVSRGDARVDDGYSDSDFGRHEQPLGQKQARACAKSEVDAIAHLVRPGANRWIRARDVPAEIRPGVSDKARATHQVRPETIRRVEVDGDKGIELKAATLGTDAPLKLPVSPDALELGSKTPAVVPVDSTGRADGDELVTGNVVAVEETGGTRDFDAALRRRRQVQTANPDRERRDRDDSPAERSHRG